MKVAHHKLLRVSGGRPFFAAVTVECGHAVSGPVVQVASSAVADRYDDWRGAAIRGVFYALHHAVSPPPLTSLSVTVTQIIGTDVDTEESAVAAAACHATWEALAVTGTHPPRFEGRSIIFAP